MCPASFTISMALTLHSFTWTFYIFIIHAFIVCRGLLYYAEFVVILMLYINKHRQQEWHLLFSDAARRTSKNAIPSKTGNGIFYVLCMKPLLKIYFGVVIAALEQFLHLLLARLSWI